METGGFVRACTFFAAFSWWIGVADQGLTQDTRIPAPARRTSLTQPPGLTDDDPVGRRYVPPMELPPAPAGVEALMDADDFSDLTNALTLKELLDLAGENNPTLIQAQEQIDGTLGKAIEAGLYPNPRAFYIGEQIFVDTPRDTDSPGEFQGGAIQQEIVTANKRKLSRLKYLERVRVAEFLAVAQQYKVCNDVRMHFWRALGQRQIVDVRRELLKAAEDHAVTARELFNLGQATRAELHQANVRLQRARLSLLNAENQYRSQFGVLTSFAGVELDARPLAGELESDDLQPIDVDAALVRIYDESPEILAARAKWQADSITVERELVEPIPNIFVRVGTGYNFVERETVATATVFLDVPIYDRNQGTIQQAEADLRRQGAEIRRTELRLRTELYRRYQDYLTALQHVTEFQSVILPEARAAYANQLDAYKEDRQNWTDVLQSQEAYFNLQEQYVNNLVLWRQNETLINGFLLHGGLEAAPEPVPPGHIDSVPQPR